MKCLFRVLNVQRDIHVKILTHLQVLVLMDIMQAVSEVHLAQSVQLDLPDQTQQMLQLHAVLDTIQCQDGLSVMPAQLVMFEQAQVSFLH